MNDATWYLAKGSLKWNVLDITHYKVINIYRFENITNPPRPRTNALTPLPLVPHISVSELDQHWFM